MPNATDWFVTLPREASSERRGDPLGFRRLADHYADTLTPQLNGATFDARWVTILAWCLVKSQAAWNAQHSGAPRTPAEKRERYSWVQPLEMLWLARSLELDRAGRRQLRGRRAVAKWLREREGGNGTMSATDRSRFGMSEPEWRRYRQSGPYGTYRTLFTGTPLLTEDRDGYTPTNLARELARVLDRLLGGATTQLDGHRYGWWTQKKAAFWLERGWTNWPDAAKRDKSTAALPRKLPWEHGGGAALPEAPLLRKALFGNDDAGGIRRRAVVNVLRSSRARNHAGLCRDLERRFPAEVHGLEAFDTLGSAAVDLLTCVWQATAARSEVSVGAVTCAHGVTTCADALIRASRDWRSSDGPSQPEAKNVTALADAVERGSKHGMSAVVSSVVRHHQKHHEGLAVLELEGNRIAASFAPDGNGAKLRKYRFRLWTLSRLAVQCGVLLYRIPRALADDDDVARARRREEREA